MSSYNRKCWRVSIIIALSIVILLVIPISIAKDNPKTHRVASRILEELDEKETVSITVSFKDKISAKALKTSDIGARKLIKDKYFITHVDKDKLEELSKNPDVEKIYYNYRFGIFLQDSIPLINASSVHTLKTTLGVNLTGKGQSVCILDTGVNYSHPDLGGGWGNKVIAGWRYTNNSISINCSLDNSACKDDHNYAGKHGHGTHVAGIVAANGTIKGVAPEANIVVIKVLNDTGFGTEADIARGIEWCTNYSGIYNISAISMSIGTSGYHKGDACDSDFPILAGAIDYARANNVSVVVATGNEADYNEISSPACIANSTRVCATDKSDNFYTNGNRGGNFTDILLAPGVSINSTKYTFGYESKTGTSMAAPHISGVMALLFQYEKQEENKSISPQQFIDILNSTGKILYDSQSGKNYSRVDTYEALLSIDDKSPIINISYPSSGSKYKSLGSYFLNFSISEVNLNTSSCKYSINNGSNISIPNCSDTSFNISSDGEYNLTIYAKDNSNNTNYSTISFQVGIGPSITLISPQNGSAFEPGTFINFTIIDSDNVSFAIYNGTKNGILTNISNDIWYINTSGWNTGEHNLTIIANDTLNTSNNNSYVFYLDYTPNITFWSWYSGNYSSNSTNITYANVTCLENETLIFNITANDTDAFPNLIYIWKIDGVNISNETQWSYTPGLRDAGSHNISLLISDSKLNTSEEWNFTIIDPWPPTFNLENKSLNEDTLLTYDIDATDDDGDNLTYYDNSSYFDINSSSGLISWTPANPGAYNVIITVSDGSNNVSKDFTITVNNVVENRRSSGGGGSGSSLITISNLPSKTQIFSQISPGEESEMNIESTEIPVSKVSLTSDEILKNVEVTVTSLEEKPEELSSSSNNVYHHISITSSSDKLKGEIVFKVNKSWINENNIDPNTIYLSRYESVWEKLETRRSGEDTNNIYYTAKVPGFSYFAINGEKVVEEEVANITEKEEVNITEESIINESNKSDTIGVSEETEKFGTADIFLLIVLIILIITVIYLKHFKDKL